MWQAGYLPWPLKDLVPTVVRSCTGRFPSQSTKLSQLPMHRTFSLSPNTLPLVFGKATSTVVPVKPEVSCTSSCPPEDSTSPTLAAAIKTTAPHVQGASSCCNSQFCTSWWKGEMAVCPYTDYRSLPWIPFGSSSLSIGFIWGIKPLIPKKFQDMEKKEVQAGVTLISSISV